MNTALAVQKAIVTSLTNAPDVTALVGDRIFDSVPKKASFPYIRISDIQLIDDGNACANGYEVFSTIHIFSEAKGRIEAKRIADAVRPVLATEIAIEGHDTIVGQFNDERYTDDPNPLVTHGILTFRYLVEPVD